MLMMQITNAMDIEKSFLYPELLALKLILVCGAYSWNAVSDILGGSGVTPSSTDPIPLPVHSKMSPISLVVLVLQYSYTE
jgi:hypothetical protein